MWVTQISRAEITQGSLFQVIIPFSAATKYPKTRVSAGSDPLTLLSKLTESQTRAAKDPVSHSQRRNWKLTEVTEPTQGHTASWRPAA